MRDELVTLREALGARLADLRSELEARFGDEPSLEELRRRLAEIAYLQTLHGDVDEALGD